MVVGTTSLELIAITDKGIGKGPGICDDLLSIGLPFRSCYLEKSSGNSGDGLEKNESTNIIKYREPRLTLLFGPP